MIKVSVTRNGPKERYELDFKQGKAQWCVFLNDKVIEDPLQFMTWLRHLVEDLQYKKGA